MISPKIPFQALEATESPAMSGTSLVLPFITLIVGISMGMRLVKSGILVLAFGFVSVPAMASHPASYCSLEGDETKGQIEGVHTEDRLPIGSVSKLVTTYWALSVMKSNYRFPTRIFISPIPGQSTSTVDLHFEGSRDPYFGKESLHYLISELNKMKIYKIRELSFDHNFKFFWNVSGGPTMTPGTNKVETGYYGPDAPTADQVTTELKKYRRNLAFGYGNTRAYLQKSNIELIPNGKLSVETVKYVPAEEFQAPENSVVRMIYSSPIVNLLKEMNRNSNNHAANQIFEHLGGAAKFQEFINGDGFSNDEILFVNGHGNRKDIDATESVYNEASCATIVKVMSRLRKKLLTYKMDMDDVLAVPGLDQHSTLGAYQNKPYADSMAAKTGTVGPAVTLAGMLQSKDGPVFFMYNMSTEGTRRDWSRARKAIAVQLTNLTKKFTGGTPFDSQRVKFVGFDAELFFHEDDLKEESEIQTPATVAVSVPVNSAPALPPKQTSTATIPQIGPNFNVPVKAVAHPAKGPVKSAVAPAVIPVAKTVAAPDISPAGQPLKTYKLAPAKVVVKSKVQHHQKSVAATKPARKTKTKSHLIAS